MVIESVPNQTNDAVAHDDYRRVEPQPGDALHACPLCGSPAEVWKWSKNFAEGPVRKFVACTNDEPFGPQPDVMGGCLLYLPPGEFYRDRVKEAVEYWNQYATAIINLRRENGL